MSLVATIPMLVMHAQTGRIHVRDCHSLRAAPQSKLRALARIEGIGDQACWCVAERFPALVEKSAGRGLDAAAAESPG